MRLSARLNRRATCLQQEGGTFASRASQLKTDLIATRRKFNLVVKDVPLESHGRVEGESPH